MNTDTKKAEDMKTSTNEVRDDKKMDAHKEKKLDDKAPMEKKEETIAK